MATLETERLLLRPFSSADAGVMHATVYGDAEVARYYCGQPLSREAVEQRMLWWSLYVTRRTDGLHAIERKADGLVLGIAGLQLLALDFVQAPDDPPTPYCTYIVELSYALGRHHQGHGYAFEAATAWIDYGFSVLRVPRLTNVVHQLNGPSIELMRRLGFRIVPNISPRADGVVLGLLDNDRV